MAPRPPHQRREGQWTIRTIQPHYRVVLIFKGLKLRNNEVIDGVKNGSAWTLLYYLNICNSVAITTRRKMQYGKIFKSNKSKWKNKVTVLRQSFKSHLSKFNYSYQKKNLICWLYCGRFSPAEHKALTQMCEMWICIEISLQARMQIMRGFLFILIWGLSSQRSS